MSAYDELYTVNMGRGELVYLGTKLVPPRNARSDIVESAHQGHCSTETIYNEQDPEFIMKVLNNTERREA